MSSAAQREKTSTDYQPTGTEGGGALKELVAARLAAHRSRRAVVEGREAQVRREQVETQAAVRLQARRVAARAEGHPDVSRVREAVAARYEKSVSYGEFLAAEAQRAIAKARAEAEVAALNAKAVRAAQQKLLDEIEQWNQPVMPPPAVEAETLFGEMPVLEVAAPREELAAWAAEAVPAARAKKKAREEASFDFASSEPMVALTLSQLQVRMPEEAEWASRGESYRTPSQRAQGGADELAELDEEIEFRLAPEFDALVLGTQSIPGNIIEFPRELVASRKARPRLAEGPLLADETLEPQLRIFEVQPETISVEAESSIFAGAPEWQGLLLGGGPAAETRARISREVEAQLQLDQQLYVAPVSRRALAATIDALCVAGGLAAFAFGVAKFAGPGLQDMPQAMLGVTAAISFAVFGMMYQLLFFTLNDATPGMRMARVAFCTFREGNPSRRAMRRRLVSSVLAACPLGMGLVWMMLDSDGLGWHDRMSRMYPRAY